MKTTVSRCLIALACVLSLSMIPTAGVAANGLPTAGRHDPAHDTISATLNGGLLAVSEMTNYACHDRDYPTFRCFDTIAQMSADLDASVRMIAPTSGVTTNGSIGSMAAQVVWITTVYVDINYSNAALAVTSSLWSMPSGWNDIVSSSRNQSGQDPCFWQGVGYSGGGLRFGAGAWIPNYVPYYFNDIVSSIAASC